MYGILIYSHSVLGYKHCQTLILSISVSSNLPVMIWIYGGGFVVGSTTWPDLLGDYIYNGQEIANKGDVIVVTFGYRLGVLGFLSTGDSCLPGKYSKLEPLQSTSIDLLPHQEIMGSGTSMPPLLGCTETFVRLEEIQTTSPSLGSQQVAQVSASR